MFNRARTQSCAEEEKEGFEVSDDRIQNALRRRVAIELLLFVLGSALYLGLWRHRPAYADMSFGFVGLGLIFLLAWRTHEQIWGAPLAEPRRRLRESSWAMLLWTAPSIAIFAVSGCLLAHNQGQGADEILHRFFRPTFFLSLPFYFVYAFLQQALFQYYLLGRLRILLPGAAAWQLALLNGALYGAMHLSAVSDWMLLALTVGGGIVWTLTYYRWRVLLPIALSHAMLGATYFYWVRNDDKMATLMGAFSGKGH